MDNTIVDCIRSRSPFSTICCNLQGKPAQLVKFVNISTLISVLNHPGGFSNQVTLRFKLQRPDPFFRVHWEHWHPKVPPPSLELPEQESAEAMETGRSMEFASGSMPSLLTHWSVQPSFDLLDELLSLTMWTLASRLKVPKQLGCV